MGALTEGTSVGEAARPGAAISDHGDNKTQNPETQSVGASPRAVPCKGQGRKEEEMDSRTNLQEPRL